MRGAVAERRLRQVSFLKRRPERSWRPVKRYRTGAKSFLLAVENSLQWGAEGLSLSYFQQPAQESQRPPALQWPKLHLAVDLESVNVSAINWLQRMKVPLWVIWGRIE